MKQLTYAFFILFIATSGFTQTTDNAAFRADWSPEIYQVGKIYPGYIVKNEGDTIQGFLKAQNRCSINGIGNSNQNMVLFYLHQSDKKPTEKYKPSDIKGYKIADKIYESLNFSGGLMKSKNFNLMIQEGAIRLYEWYATVTNYTTLYQQSGETWQQFDARRFEIKEIVAKTPEEPIETKLLGLSFAKKMPKLIADNPELAQKVANKEKGYNFLHLYDVIDTYNQWAASKK